MANSDVEAMGRENTCAHRSVSHDSQRIASQRLTRARHDHSLDEIADTGSARCRGVSRCACSDEKRFCREDELDVALGAPDELGVGSL